MIKPNTKVIAHLGGEHGSLPATVVGIAYNFTPTYIIYIVNCPGVLEYDCFQLHSSMIEEIE